MARRVTLSHGGGGVLTRELVEEVFLPAFGNDVLRALDDAALLDRPAGRIAFTTDSFVVKPLFFRGGDIGRLAVSGTVNDLAACGASPLGLSLGLVIEEGLEIDTLRRVADSLAATAREAAAPIVAGDTKVVERGAADGLYINTAGVGALPTGPAPGAGRIRPGDRVLISGALGDHGIAVLSEREGLRFETEILSDVAPLGGLVEASLEAGEVHALRDPTRGGAAAALNELAEAAGIGVEIDEEAVPVHPAVRAASDMLGLDPLSIANEGKMILFVAEADAGGILDALRAHPRGEEAAIVGEAVEGHPGVVAVRTRIGSRKVLEMPHGEGLPRIC